MTFSIDKTMGLLAGADSFIASPNYNERPENTIIDLLVIHNISLPPGQFGGPFVAELFTNTLNCQAEANFQSLMGLQVSAHLFIQRTGLVTQFVPLNKRAWHAGISTFQGRENCNDFSIGIELEGTDTLPYEAIQYQQLAKITRTIRQTYPAITLDRIVGHADIAPGRKTDPGMAFDWSHYRELFFK